MSLANHTYETETLQIAASIMTNPWAVLIVAGAVFVCGFILVMAIAPSLFFRDVFKRK